MQNNITWSNNYFTIIGAPQNLKIVQKRTGAVAIPTDRKRFLLITISRKDGLNHWEFPRGFAEEGENSIQTAVRELKEETGLDSTGQAEKLGYVMPDSGLIDSKIALVKIPVSFEQKIRLQSSEKILDYKVLTFDELTEMVLTGEIVDGYTLASFAKIKSNALTSAQSYQIRELIEAMGKVNSLMLNHPHDLKLRGDYEEMSILMSKLKNGHGLSADDERTRNILVSKYFLMRGVVD